MRNPSRRRGDRNVAAALLGLSPRTLSRWRGKAGLEKVGRPSHSLEAKAQTRDQVLPVLRMIGYRAGRRTMKLKLPDVPWRLLSDALDVLKAERDARLAEHLNANRMHIQVLATGVLMTEDSTHVGYFKKRKVWAEVFKDVASTWSWAEGDGHCLNHHRVLGHLEGLWSRGVLPLVLATDNGPAYKEYWVQHALHKEKVIHLFSRPHTPQHNPWVERCIGEGKALAELNANVVLQSWTEGVRRLDDALQTLNNHWPRQSRGGLTAAQLEDTLPDWSKFVSRSEFYAATDEAIKKAVTEAKGKNERYATREAIFRTLERFGLILRTRGE